MAHYRSLEGQVSVSWDRKPNGDATTILMLEWRELRGPPLATEVPSGYGTGLTGTSYLTNSGVRLISFSTQVE